MLHWCGSGNIFLLKRSEVTVGMEGLEELYKKKSALLDFRKTYFAMERTSGILTSRMESDITRSRCVLLWSFYVSLFW